MIQAQVALVEKMFCASDEKFDEIKGRLSSSAATAMTHSEIESMVETEGRALLRCLFEDHVALRTLEEQKAPALRVVGEDDVARDHRRDRSHKLETLFGEIEVGRIGYSVPGSTSRFPLDAALNLPADQFSFGVRKRVAVEAARGSFDEAAAALARNTGAQVAKRQVEALSQCAAVDFTAFYERRKALDAETLAASSDLLVLTLDGKGIIMRLEDLRPATKKAAEKNRHKMNKRLSPGEKKNRKRMAMVAAVYTTAPHIRTAEEIAYGPAEGQKVKRPRPECKRVWASIEKDPDVVVREIFVEGLRRDPQRQKTWVALSDGNETQLALLKRLAVEHGVQLTIIVDIIHVLEYVWDAAPAFNPKATPEIEAWVTERLVAILHGKSSDVAAGMRRSATLRGLCANDRIGVDACAHYLLKYAPFLHYNSYLALGLPIATGVIEGACRHLIQDRMDITGARWGLAGAEAVLRLRSLRSSGDFDEYWRFHERQEYERNHAARYEKNRVPMSPASRRARMRLVS